MSDSTDRPSLVIRGGTVIDGSGGPPREAAVSIVDGRIAAIGKVTASGAEEIDARGKLVMPGFVDVHTHYDAQVTWTSHITPSSCNGVTTAVLGNCGVGFAPCRPEQREMLVRLMEGVEDIPEVVLTEGLPWTWHSFPDYLDMVAARQFDLDVAAQVPHAALRVYVMGQRAADLEPATPDDARRMGELAAEGIRAGALGFSTSRTLNHRAADGRPIPTLKAEEDELLTIAKAIGETGAGWLQVVDDFAEERLDELPMLRRLVEASGRPMTITLLERHSKPEEWRRLLAGIADANAAGHVMTGQIRGRPTSVLYGFELSLNPFSGSPHWREIGTMPFAKRIAALRDPDVRARLIAPRKKAHLGDRDPQDWDMMFALGDPPNYEPAADQSIGAEARRRGVDPAALAYDLMLEKGGKNILYRPMTNFAHGNLEPSREMMAHPNTLIGLGDGGAHVGIMCDATDMTHGLTHWTRDRKTGPRFPIEFMVKRLTSDNARAVGLNDRGLLTVGRKADINIVDYDRLRIQAPQVLYDLPGGGKRLMQKSDGYVATICSGVPVFRDGEPTGELPGRLVRGPQAA